MDTDSFALYIKADYNHKDISKNVEMEFDISNW